MEGAYTLEGPLRRVRLDAVTARFDSLEYELQRTASVAWGDSALTVEDLEVRRLGPDLPGIKGKSNRPC